MKKKQRKYNYLSLFYKMGSKTLEKQPIIFCPQKNKHKNGSFVNTGKLIIKKEFAISIVQNARNVCWYVSII